jgi:hypothetical protein
VNVMCDRVDAVSGANAWSYGVIRGQKVSINKTPLYCRIKTLHDL